ncbi:MAG: hypothetical protein JNJ88_03530 [Planctomycetes bacterium]|nr:hypothetical protein [Planctomycetota bacterium]
MVTEVNWGPIYAQILGTLRNSARRALRPSRAILWGMLAAAGALAIRPLGDFAAADAPIAKLAWICSIAGTLAGSIAFLLPCLVLGRKASRPGDILWASRPVSPWISGPGLALCSWGCALGVWICVMLVGAALGEANGAGMRPRIRIADGETQTLSEKGERARWRMEAPANSLIRIAPEVGLASAYGDASRVPVRVFVGSDKWQQPLELSLSGRTPTEIAASKPGEMTVEIERVSSGPRLRFDRASVRAVGAPSSAAEVLWYLAVAWSGSLAAFAGVGSLLAALLDRSVVILAGVSLAVLLTVLPNDDLRVAFGLETASATAAWFDREIAQIGVPAAPLVAALASSLLAAAARRWRR